MNQVGIKNRLVNGLLLGFLVFVFFVLANSLITAFGWLGRPSPGSSLEPSLISSFYLTYVLGWLFFAMSLLAYKDHLTYGRFSGLVLFGGSMAVLLATAFDLVTTFAFAPIWIAALSITAAGFLHLAILQFKPFRLENQLIVLAYLIAIAAAIFTWNIPNGPAAPLPFLTYISWILIFNLTLLVLGMFLMLFAAISAKLQENRKQKWILLGCSFAAFAPLALWAGLYLLTANVAFQTWLLLPVYIFPLTIMATKRKFADIDPGRLGNELAQNVLLSVIISLGYGFIVSGIGLIFFRSINFANPFINGFLIFLAALLFLPLKAMLEKWVGRQLRQRERSFSSRETAFTADLKRLTNLDAIVNLLRSDIQEAVHALHVHIFLFDPITNLYRATNFGSQRTSDLLFEPDSGLVKYLAKESRGQSLSDIRRLPNTLKADAERVQMLGARLFFPIQGQKQLLGWAAISHRLGDSDYSKAEIDYLNTIVEQAALSIERSLVIDNLERRMHESNVLARVAQGVNYTVKLPDICEFIYTQITQIASPEAFVIALKGLDGSSLIQVFCIESNERIPAKENILLDSQSSLEAMVISQGRTLFAEDYKQECAARNAVNPREDVISALFLPLNTGAETIGVIMLGRHSRYQHFAPDQIALLQAMVDHCAGAIVKARLLQEWERRAYQLSKLNHLTQKLNATLSLPPLYQSILDISMEIIGSKCGAFFRVDPLSKSYGVQTVAGEAFQPEQIANLASANGFVRDAILQARPQIIRLNKTDYPNSIAENADADQIPGTALIVPLLSKGEVSGLIELFDRKDELPFSRSDQDLLTIIAAQASVAIDNAILYSNTDQALSKRVEELSIMQHIDRELNATLDLMQVLDITLHWAIQQAGAAAGFIALFHQGTYRIERQQGYRSQDLDGYVNLDLPPAFLDVEGLMSGGVPRQNPVSEGTLHFLPGARLQVLVPVCRKEQALAFVALEFLREEHLEDAAVDFLARLSDHASIALVNGQLYADLRAASLAKSEFVSLVAHELKNPMTSIKGYTELLAGGAVGDVNDAQSSFLSTIRSNVDRMDTLVSDLNDLTKIEAGRLRLEFKMVNLREILDEVLRSNSRAIEEKQQILETEVPPDLPNVWADPTRLAQVLINLVNNANKYSEKGTKISIGARVENHAEHEAGRDMIHLWVKDNGIGIKPEDQEKIFHKFFRSEDPKTREVSGTGLGLNITRSMVELQGGKIWFESEFRQGSVFHLLMPIAAQQ